MRLARKLQENYLVELREQLNALDRFTNEFAGEDVQALREEGKGGMQKETAILKALENAEIGSVSDARSSKGEGEEVKGSNEEGASKPKLTKQQTMMAEVISKINKKIKSKEEKQKQLNEVNSAYARLVEDLGVSLSHIHRGLETELSKCLEEHQDSGARTTAENKRT